MSAGNAYLAVFLISKTGARRAAWEAPPVLPLPGAL